MIKSYSENEFKVKVFAQPFAGEVTLPAKEDLVRPACIIQRDFRIAKPNDWALAHGVAKDDQGFGVYWTKTAFPAKPFTVFSTTY